MKGGYEEYGIPWSGARDYSLKNDLDWWYPYITCQK